MYRILYTLCLLLIIYLPVAAQQEETVQPAEVVQINKVEKSDVLPARSFGSLNRERLSKSSISKTQPGDSPPPFTRSQSFNTQLFDGDASNAVGSNQQSASPSEWEFAITPYFFTAGLSGRVGARGRTAEVDAGFSDIWDHLDFGLMGTFEAGKANWGVLVDTMYISLSSEATTRGLLFSSINSKTKLFILDPEVSYRAVNLKRGSIDLLAGVRIWHLKNSLTFEQGLLLPQVDVSESKNWADPVVGARGVFALSPRLFLTGKFDVGGFGVGSDFTGQAFGGVGINVKPRVALIGGYRYLYVDYRSGGFLFNTELKGLILGAKFKF